MPLKIIYWTASQWNQNVPGAVISSEALAISGTSAQSGVTPSNAMFISLRNTETGGVAFKYDSANPTAVATGPGIGPQERLWLDAVPGNKVAGITES